MPAQNPIILGQTSPKRDEQPVDSAVERRARNRATTYKHAKIRFNDDKSVYDAVMRNVTAYGATLTVALTEQLPDNFNLHMVRDDLTVSCRVIWRRSDCIGVAF